MGDLWPTCKTCPHWRMVGDARGTCDNDPPPPVVARPGISHSVVYASDWCAKHPSRTPPEPDTGEGE